MSTTSPRRSTIGRTQRLFFTIVASLLPVSVSYAPPHARYEASSLVYQLHQIHTGRSPSPGMIDISPSCSSHHNKSPSPHAPTIHYTTPPDTTPTFASNPNHTYSTISTSTPSSLPNPQNISNPSKHPPCPFPFFLFLSPFHS